MADVTAILTAFRAELIAAGLVRRPSEAGPLHPMHVAPIDGPPAPGESEGIEDDPTLVLSLLHSGDLAEATGYDAALRRRAVLDVRYRGFTNAALREAYALDAAIRGRLIAPATSYGYGFFMGGLQVLEANVFAGLGPISSSKATGFDLVAKWALEVGA